MHGRRRALITGANRGIGRGVAHELASRGLEVVVAARDPSAASAVAAELGGPATGVGLDLTEPGDVLAAHRQVGEIDVLVCNAGILLDDGATATTVDLDRVARTFAVNTLGAWRVCQAFVPGMIARGRGRVVLLTSGCAVFAHGLPAGLPGYATSKVGVNALAALLGAETAGTGVLVNAVNPGRVRTRMMPDADGDVVTAAAAVADAATLPDDGPTGRVLRSGAISPW